ncbi:MAG: hypothetical protein KKC03_04350 [Bacteroidetes bacterium]|nr:hypothetical protein [Bacteroidota bacterium]
MKQYTFFLYFVLCIVFQSNAQSEWKLIKDNEDIKVYVRTNDTTSYKEYRAITIVPTHIEEVYFFLMDANNLHKWHYQTSESRVLKKINDSEQLVYMKNDMPWPLQDRDVVTRMKVSRPTLNIIRIDLLPELDYLPSNQKIVRIKNFKGHWYLEKSEKGTIVIQEMQGDPGGNIPPFLFNIFLTNGPFSTFLEMKKLLSRI